MAHGRGVTEKYLAVANYLDEGYWDEVVRETSYFLEQDDPLDPPPRGEKGREVGEVDVWAFNFENNDMLAVEVKTNRADLSYAYDQLDRVDNHFDDWDVIKQTYLVD